MRKWKDGHAHWNNKKFLHNQQKPKRKFVLEQMKRGVKRSAQEWDDFVLQEQLKSLMYVDRSSGRYLKKDKLIAELNFKNFMRLKERQQASSSLLLHTKKESLLFIQNILMPTISSHIHSFRISNINQTWFRTCQ